jgi:predicted dehydrogenase
LIQQDYPVNSYASLEDLLRSDAHLVIVNTPVGTHFEYAKKVLLAGKHAIVEKPLPLRSRSRRLVALATEKGVKLSVFQNRRWDSDLKTVRQVLLDV